MRDVIYYIFPDVMTLSFYFLGNEKEKQHVEYIVACFLPGPTTLRPPQKPGPETHFFRAKLESFYSAQTAQNSLESFTTMRSCFIDCAGARRENRRPLDCQRGQPAGSVWVRTGAPTGPQPRRRHNIKGFTPFHFYSICNTLL